MPRMLRHSIAIAASAMTFWLHASSGHACEAHTLPMSDWQAVLAIVSAWHLDTLYPMSIALLGVVLWSRTMR